MIGHAESNVMKASLLAENVLRRAGSAKAIRLRSQRATPQPNLWLR